MDLKSTPLLNEHKRLSAKLAPFGGWLMPIQYDGIIAEHNQTRAASSLFDICHMGEFLIEGEPSQSGLNRIVTVDISKMPQGSCRYCFMLNEKGSIIDDLLVYRVKSGRYMLVVNAATTENDFNHLEENLSKDTLLKDISAETAKFDLQGPLSADILADFIGPEIRRLEYYTFGTFNILGKENIISRTGYTGELGYEIYIEAAKAEELWASLLKDERVKPAGLGARDTLRLEMGYPLYGQDIDGTVTPVEAGLENFVDYDKDFTGKDALLKIKNRPYKHLVCFIADSRRSPRHANNIYSGKEDIGTVTSGSFSPSLDCGIGMGYVQTDHEKLGSKIIIKTDRADIEAVITDKPFYKRGTARVSV